MNFTHNEKNAGKNFTGITIVVLLHILVAYGIVTGLGKRLISKMAEPVETKIIEEVKPPPPKELPPPFIPPVEVNVQQPPPVQNVIAAATNVKPQSNELQKPAPAAPPAPPSHATGIHVNAVADMSTCAKPEYPKSSLRNEETGTSTLKFLIGLDGHVVEAQIVKSSGFRDLDKAAIGALSKCKFKPGTTDGKPEQSWAPVAYVWTLD